MKSDDVEKRKNGGVKKKIKAFLQDDVYEGVKEAFCKNQNQYCGQEKKDNLLFTKAKRNSCHDFFNSSMQPSTRIEMKS